MPRPNPNSRKCTQLLQDLEKVQTEATKSSHIKIFSRKVYMVAKDCKRFLFDNSYLEWLEVKHPMRVEQLSPRKLAKVVWHRMLHAKATTQAAKVVY